jgi:cystathionine beta-lyase/cystathionine gamma-synthase
VRPFIDALEFFAVTPSLGSVESLAMPPQFLRVRGLPAELQALSGIGDGTIRLSIGIEDSDELVGDLESALGGVR